MNYDTVILEMLTRIQALEAKVEILSQGAKLDESGEQEKISTADIREYIVNLIEDAERSGKNELVLKASDIHNAMKLKSRYPMVCNAMRQCMRDKDAIVFETQSGYSSTLEIRYICKR